MNERIEKVPLIAIARHRLSTDGEGVTTLVAFHGCPLRCEFCLNPQSICTEEEGVWKYYDPRQLYDEVKKDELYFLATGGGITFGGGEPYLRSHFISAFRALCGPQWSLTLETSLNVPREWVEKLLSVVNSYIVDIKDMNELIYHNYTGQSNARVIDNLRYLAQQGKAEQITVRIPLITSYNTEEDREESISRLKEMGFSHFDLFTYRTPINTPQP